LGLFDFFFKRSQERQLGLRSSAPADRGQGVRAPVGGEFREVETIDRAIRVIQKNPYMKYAYDLELLQAIEKFQEQLAVNQQLILDAVTVKDPEKGQIGLAEWLVSGTLLEQIKEARRAAPPLAPRAAPAAAPSPRVEVAERKINELKARLATMEKELEKEREKVAGAMEERVKVEGEREALEEEVEKIERKAGVKKRKEVKVKRKPVLEPTPIEKPLVPEKIEKIKPEPIAEVEEAAKELEKPKGVIGKAIGELKGVPSLLKPKQLFKRKARFDSFVYGNFYFEYPQWPADLHVAEDVILSVSSGPFGVELSVKELYPLTFGAYITKITALIKEQLKAKIIKQKTSIDSAYLEFEFKQQGVTWLYKSKVIECDERFYTVAVKGPKDRFSKIGNVAETVLGSIKCLK